MIHFKTKFRNITWNRPGVFMDKSCSRLVRGCSNFYTIAKTGTATRERASSIIDHAIDHHVESLPYPACDENLVKHYTRNHLHIFFAFRIYAQWDVISWIHNFTGRLCSASHKKYVLFTSSQSRVLAADWIREKHYGKCHSAYKQAQK